MKRFFAAIVFLVVIVALPFLGGSMPKYLRGAHGLDIDGVAARIDRPGDTVPATDGWPEYGADAGGSRFSLLDVITTDNVRKLEVAWEFSTGDLATHAALVPHSASEATPILTDDALVFCTPFNEVIALNPGDGSERWRFDPGINLDQRPANNFVCRGVSHWSDPGSSGVCASRIYMGTNDARLIAIDAQTGRRCEAFGDNGEVRIDPGMELWWPGEFQITSPPVIVGHTVIIGSAISDNARVVAPAGSVRAFDVRSGAPKWDFDPIPRSDESAVRSDWQGAGIPVEGHANAWAPMSVDAKRGLVFVPTTSPSPDFYGGLRPGDNRYANSVVALNGDTGEVVWSFQTVHHDLWDYDISAQPGLYSVWREGKVHEVVAQVTKMGLLFVLDRDTGMPFLPVEERPVPQRVAPGDMASATQPFPVATPQIVPDRVSPDDAFGITWFDRRQCRKLIESSLADGIYTPPSEQGTILLPFTGGGANWGSAAFDPTRNLLVVNMSNVAHHVQLFPADQFEHVREVFHDQEVSPQEGAPFGMKRTLLLSSLKLPCTPPPWGIIAGIDLSDGHIVWRKTIGTTEDLSAAPGFELGTPTLGGPIVTAGGLVFIGAAMDHYLRAFDVKSGVELWRGRLPAPAFATPMTYRWNGRQYVVIYAGGYGRLDTALDDRLIAFALPRS